MWRALFLASGIVLIILGVECTVVGRFTISQDARLPTFVEKMFSEGPYGEGRYDGSMSNAFGWNQSPAVAPAQSIQGYGGLPNNVSRYGPSRFSSNGYGNEQFFGGSTTNAQPTSAGTTNPQMILAGYGPNVKSDSAVWSSNAGMKKIVQTRDWMPWSLIAAGAIMVLYTNSLGSREFSNGG